MSSEKFFPATSKRPAGKLTKDGTFSLTYSNKDDFGIALSNKPSYSRNVIYHYTAIPEGKLTAVGPKFDDIWPTDYSFEGRTKDEKWDFCICDTEIGASGRNGYKWVFEKGEWVRESQCVIL